MIISATLALPFSANAQIEQGSCGANVSYTLDTTTGELSVFGTGAMTDYDWDQSPFATARISSILIFRRESPQSAKMYL